MRDQVDESLSAQRVIATLSAFFGTLATLLAGIGLYGVMAYTVTRRTREIGIRLALGAGRGSLLGMVMREAAVLTLAGVAIAIPIALARARLVVCDSLQQTHNHAIEFRRRRLVDRLIQIVGGLVIPVLDPVMKNPVFRSAEFVAEFECQRGHAAPDEAVLIAADEPVLVRLFVRLHAHSGFVRRRANRIAQRRFAQALDLNPLQLE